MEIQSIVDVAVSANSPQVTRAGYGKPMILGTHTRWSERWRKYATLAAMVDDGFLATDVEYKMAAKMFAQPETPEEVFIGRRTHLPTQKWTFTPTAVHSATYSLLIGGMIAGTYTEETITITADSATTATEINTALKTAIDLIGWGLTVTAGATMTIVATTAGAWYRMKNMIPGRQALVMDSVNNAVATDLAEIFQENSEWYAVLTPFPSAAELTEIAIWSAASKRPLLYQTQDTPTITGTTGNIGKTLKDTSNGYAWGIFSNDNANFLDAGWGGRMLPQDPGSETWKFATLTGCSIEVLTDTQISNLNTNNLNWYVTVGGVAITGEGIAASGEFIDKVRGIDWFASRTRERIFGTLASASPGKIPMTDKGISAIQADLLAQMQEAVDVGLFTGEDPLAPVISVPKAADIDSGDRASRLLKNLTGIAYLAGAVHKTQVRINVLA